MKNGLIIMGLIFLSNVSMAQDKWVVDPTHSSVQFAVNHLVVSEVSGKFKSFSGSVIMNEGDFSTAQIEGEVIVNSIETGNGQRDNHLKASDFFDESSHPKITFKSKRITKTDDNKYAILGELTMKGVIKEVQFIGNYKGSVSFMGQTKAGLKATGKVNRFDFGLSWNALLEAGGAVVGEQVELEMNLELVKTQ